MSFSARETSRTLGEPVDLFLFRGSPPTVESLLKSVTMIPGATEFGYGTTPVNLGATPLNHLSVTNGTDIQDSIDDLLAAAPDLSHVSLVVAWHGTDLRAGSCKIIPKAQAPLFPYATTPYEWVGGGIARINTTAVSSIAGVPALGGAPADRSVYEAIVELRSRGLKVTLYPFVIMDIAAANILPDPYTGLAGQPVYPWRGRITCDPAPGVTGTVDGTSTAATQISAFFGPTSLYDIGWDSVKKQIIFTGNGLSDHSYRRFILSMARIAKEAGATDFLIGSEMIGLTNVRSAPGTYPAVDKLITLAADVRTLVGAGISVTYAADWSEYHAHRPNDGSGDVYFNLDPLWADANIDYIGIDNYFPLSDWRDTSTHLDKAAGYTTIYDAEYLDSNVEGGELYDWFYATSADRTNQVRTSISDTALGKDWVFRQKDLRSWWASDHYDRPGGTESAVKTAWTKESKPIVFTELGCPAVNKGSNQPNAFVDTNSSESVLPYFSNGVSDPAMQRAHIEALLSYWSGPENQTSTVYTAPMIDMSKASIWTWDARPYPTFPDLASQWADGPNWVTGHWLTGRLVVGRSFAGGLAANLTYTNGDAPVIRNGVTFTPWPVTRGSVSSSGSGDEVQLDVTLAKGSPIDEMFMHYPPSTRVGLTIFQGHVGETGSVGNWPALWNGVIQGVSFSGNEAKLTCMTTRSSLLRPGLRRNYQLGCPFALYQSQCSASSRVATVGRSVASLSGSRITVGIKLGPDLPTAVLTYLNGAGTAPETAYRGGTMDWVRADGVREVRAIVAIDATGLIVTIRGVPTGVLSGTTVNLALGCNHRLDDCAGLHGNIHNYGGQPWIPSRNPLSNDNQFF